MSLSNLLGLRKILVCLTVFVASQAFSAESCDETALHGYMEDLGSELKALSADVKKGRFEEVTSRVSTIIPILEKAKAETPFLFKEEGLDGDSLRLKKQKYQDAIADLIVVFQNLDVAAKNSDADQLKSLFGDIGQARKMGHREFKARC